MKHLPIAFADRVPCVVTDASATTATTAMAYFASSPPVQQPLHVLSLPVRCNNLYPTFTHSAMCSTSCCRQCDYPAVLNTGAQAV